MNVVRGMAARLRLLQPLRRAKWGARVKAKRWRQRVRHGRFSRSGLPIVFANAMAKSGSHILSQFLEGMEIVSPLVYTDHHPIRTLGDSGQRRPPDSVLRDLGRLKAGDMGWGYLPAAEPYIRWVQDRSALMFFVYRDPRDKIISHIFYAAEIHDGHAMRDFYRGIPQMEARIEATIEGVPGLVENIRATYESYLGWLQQDRVFEVRFEDLVNRRSETVQRLLTKLEDRGVSLNRPRGEAMECVLEAMAPRHSPTFRSGTSGGWREHFTQRNINHFKERAGNLLVDLGYEEDNDW